MIRMPARSGRELRNDATLRRKWRGIQMTLQLRMLTQHDLPLATAILTATDQRGCAIW